jgi:recombination protein RecA
MTLKRRKSKEIAEEAKNIKTDILLPRPSDHIISTGSTLLDLAISGNRYRGGGIPGGILVEIYGSSGSGKTAILVDICASAQEDGGKVRFLDPEARLDKEYAEVYGMHLTKEDYHRPNTVTEMFDYIKNWKTNPDVINVIGADSLAALSTELELDKGDKMGMKRAKDFSTELRKLCRQIAAQNRLVLCTNQVRQGDYGDITPGGKAIPFYSSLRIKVKQTGKIEKSKKLKDKAIKKITGIESDCEIIKNSLDSPFRKAPIRILFGVGIDDVGANLQWLKDTLGLSKYKAVDQEYQVLDVAIKYIEENDLEAQLREEVIELFAEIEEKFKPQRKPKKRFKITCT